jgi:hypothetical protein
MDLYLRRDDLALRFFDPTQSLLIPAAAGAILVRPSALPFDPLLAGELSRWEPRVEDRGTFVIHHLGPPLPDSRLPPLPVPFDGGPTLLDTRTVVAAPGITVITYWEATGPRPEPLRIYLHAVDAAGAIAGQHDGLGTAADHWVAGDLIIQRHPIPLPPGDYSLQLGLYNPVTNVRLVHGPVPQPPSAPADTLSLGPVTVP